MNAPVRHERELPDLVALRRDLHRRPETGFDVGATASIVADAMVPAAELVLALQSIVARTLPPREHAAVSITEFVTDDAWNVIPSVVTLRGDARGYRDSVSQAIERQMTDIASGVAVAHGVQSALSYRREFRPTINSASETDRAATAVLAIPDTTVDGRCDAVGFSEDFAHFLAVQPGCFMLMGNGTDGPHGASLHNPGYDFNDAALPFGIAYWVEIIRAELGR